MWGMGLDLSLASSRLKNTAPFMRQLQICSHSRELRVAGSEHFIVHCTGCEWLAHSVQQGSTYLWCSALASLFHMGMCQVPSTTLQTHMHTCDIKVT